jgi:hypothetical protein
MDYNPLHKDSNPLRMLVTVGIGTVITWALILLAVLL